MKRILIFAAVAAAAVAVALFAALGGFSGNPASGASRTTVNTTQIGGFGTVLTDASGLPLYINDQETKGGMILCNGSCTTIWRPVTVSNGSPTGSTAAGTLGVVTRSDGTKQVTLNGKPLYTFYSDQAGKVTGDNFKDSFNGQNFSWHVVTAGGASGSSGAAPSGTRQTGASQSDGQGLYGQSGGMAPRY